MADDFDIDPDWHPAGCPHVESEDFSIVVGTTPISVFPPDVFGRSWKRYFFLRTWNTSSTATVWCSRAGTAGVGAPGSFPLHPGEYELFTAPQGIPTNPLSVVATADAVPLTVELG